MLSSHAPRIAPVIVLWVATVLCLTACGRRASPTSAPASAKVVSAQARAVNAGAAKAGASAAGVTAAAGVPAAVTVVVAPALKPPPPPPPVMAKVGGYAPDFALPSVDGQTVRLSDHKGQIVVLEWFNPDCPFVKQAHEKGALKDMARRWGSKGVFWIAINSGAVGKQGHGRERNRAAIERYGLDHPVLLDETGMVGRKYGADHTPHVFVIDGLGKLRYAGGLDNMPFGEVSEPGQQPTPHLQDALEALSRGQAPAVLQTKSWGCSVKYAK